MIEDLLYIQSTLLGNIHALYHAILTTTLGVVTAVRIQSPFWKEETELREILEVKFVRLDGLTRYDGKAGETKMPPEHLRGQWCDGSH